MLKPTEEQKQAFANDGGFVAKGFLNPAQLKQARECFDWGLANPGKNSATVFPGTEHEHYIANSNPGAWKYGLKALAHEVQFSEYAAELWGSEHVWYFSEELFMKLGGKAGSSPWHQDTSVMPTRGNHWANFWISFEPLPAKNSISIVRGSHRGKLYNGTAYEDAYDPTRPLHPDSDLPQLPDIDADIARDPTSWDLLSFATEPGDVIVFHPGSLHGGAPVDAATPDRRTLVMRFFGDDAVYSPLPDTTPPDLDLPGVGHEKWAYLDSQVDGAPFRSRMHPQVR